MSYIKQIEGIHLTGTFKKIDSGKLDNVLSQLIHLEEEIKKDNSKEIVLKNLNEIIDYLRDSLDTTRDDKNKFKQFIYGELKKEKQKGNEFNAQRLFVIYKKIDQYEVEEKEKGNDCIDFYQLYIEYLNS